MQMKTASMSAVNPHLAYVSGFSGSKLVVGEEF